MIDENQRFADKYKELEGEILQIEKTVIISEGKTDWKHFKAALSHFKENHEFEDVDERVGVSIVVRALHNQPCRGFALSLAG